MTTMEMPHHALRGGAEPHAVLAIQVHALTKTYPGGVEAVKAIDFDVERGEVFGLLGPNGAGKSTTIGMLTTTLSPTGGTALLAGLDVAHDPLAARGMSSVVFQDPVVDRSFTGRRNLLLHARLWGVDAREAAARITEIASAFGLAEISRSAGLELQRRTATAPRDRPRARFRPAGAVPRRADRGPRPPHPT